jgi:hypothetical protein
MKKKFKVHEIVYVKDNVKLKYFRGEKLWIRSIHSGLYFGEIDGFNVLFEEYELESIEEHNRCDTNLVSAKIKPEQRG